MTVVKGLGLFAPRKRISELDAAIHRSQAVIEFDLDGVILTANDNFLRTFGYSLAEIEGRHHSMFVAPDYRDSADYRALWARLNAGEHLSDTFQRVAKNGSPIWIQGAYNPILGADGRPYKVIKFANDITAIEIERAEREAERHDNARKQEMIVSILADGLRRVAAGDLTSRITAPFEGRYETIKDDFNLAVESLQRAVSAITGSSAALQGGCEEIATAAGDLSRRTEQQAANLQSTARTLDEITTIVERNAQNAKQASSDASEARVEALRSGEVMSGAIAAMDEIEKSSGQITRIIGVIDEIAFQTNLLALNAGVEAARAGDAGRGFGVVAQEVRALAQRSADSAREIKTLIADSTSQVERGVKMVADTNQALSAIVSTVAQIDGVMSEIATSSQEQAGRLNGVNKGVDQMNAVTQQNAIMVEQTTKAADALTLEARHLVERLERFGIGAAADDRSAPIARIA